MGSRKRAPLPRGTGRKCRIPGRIPGLLMAATGEPSQQQADTVTAVLNPLHSSALSGSAEEPQGRATRSCRDPHSSRPPAGQMVSFPGEQTLLRGPTSAGGLADHELQLKPGLSRRPTALPMRHAVARRLPLVLNPPFLDNKK